MVMYAHPKRGAIATSKSVASSCCVCVCYLVTNIAYNTPETVISYYAFPNKERLLRVKRQHRTTKPSD